MFSLIFAEYLKFLALAFLDGLMRSHLGNKRTGGSTLFCVLHTYGVQINHAGSWYFHSVDVAHALR